MANKIYEFWATSGAGVYEDTFASVVGNNQISYLAQSFTIGTTGTNENFIMQRVDLRLKKVGTPTNDLNVELWTADSNGQPESLISAGTIAMSDISTSDTYVSCTDFAGSTILASGKYAIVIYHADATALNNIEWLGTDLNDNYGADSDTDTIGAAWLKAVNGTTSWTRGTSGNDVRDFNFILWGSSWNVETVTYEEVLAKAGDNASADAKGISNAKLFIRQAESIVNARTRRDWTTDFNLLDENFKYIISAAVASLAAIDIINYDMSGYTSRLEAEDMKSTLRSTSELLINVLNDRKVQSFILYG